MWDYILAGFVYRHFRFILYPIALPSLSISERAGARIFGSASATVASPDRMFSMMGASAARTSSTVDYGDEIGMHDVPIPPHWVRDPFEKNLSGLGLGRDPVRTPMQSTDGPWADFSTAQPWLPLADDFMKCNVSVEATLPANCSRLSPADPVAPDGTGIIRWRLFRAAVGRRCDGLHPQGLWPAVFDRAQFRRASAQF
jgi:hypothetical protein